MQTMKSMLSAVLWIGASVAIGLGLSYLTDLNPWLCILITMLALKLNGWLAYREDRGKFND